MNLLTYVHLRNIVRSTGAGRVARQMTESLARLDGVRQHILADPGDHRRVIAEAGQPWNGFVYHFLENETSRQQARWFVMRGPGGEHYWPDAQIVYCTAESYVPTRRARLAVTLHDAAYFENHAHRTDFAFWRQRLKWKLLYGTLARRADLFHTVSQYSADRLAHFFPVIESRIRVVHNAVTQRFFDPVSAEGESYLDRNALHGREFVLLPGGLHHRKNADLVLAVWRRLIRERPDALLVVVNHSDPAYLAEAQTLGASIRFAGFVGDEELCSLYHAANIVWFPSRYEGFGMPVVEAMACGTPVVASDSSALPEVAGKAAWLASATSPDEHIEALLTLLDSASSRAALSARGAKRAAEFTWMQAATKLRSHFETVL